MKFLLLRENANEAAEVIESALRKQKILVRGQECYKGLMSKLGGMMRKNVALS